MWYDGILFVALCLGAVVACCWFAHPDQLFEAVFVNCSDPKSRQYFLPFRIVFGLLFGALCHGRKLYDMCSISYGDKVECFIELAHRLLRHTADRVDNDQQFAHRLLGGQIFNF